MKRSPLAEPCSKCGATHWERLPRTSFWMARVMDFIGRYPWRCALCNHVRYLSMRSERG